MTLEVGDATGAAVPVKPEVEVVAEHSLPDGVVRHWHLQLHFATLGLPQAVVIGQALPRLAHLHPNPAFSLAAARERLW